MRLAMEDDVPPNPGGVRLLGSAAVVPQANGCAHAIEQLRGARLHDDDDAIVLAWLAMQWHALEAMEAPAVPIPDNPNVTARFYAPDAEREGETIDLPPDEAAHLTRVLRLKVGAPVRVFNGRGGEFDGVVDSITRSRVQVRIDAAREAAAEPRVSVTLAQAVLKGDKMDDVVRDAVMMGVAAIQPIVTTRTEVTLASLQRGRRRERWERVAVASAKQCGRATVPAIGEPRTFGDVITALEHITLPGPGIMLVEPSAADGTLTLDELANAPPREATVLVGPEGGWTPDEVEQGSAACRIVTLGRRTLRADAVPIVALTALFAIWKEF